MTSAVKLKLELTNEQVFVFNQYLFASQLFRNYSVEFLRQRNQDKKSWIKQNEHTEEYKQWRLKVDETSAKMKVFNKKYKTKEEREKATLEGLKPKYPDNIHPLFDEQIGVLSKHLTEKLEQTSCWLMNNLPRFAHCGIKIPKKTPKVMYDYYNSLPKNVRRSLQASAKNENVLLYLMQVPRGVLDQTIQDLKKTYNKAFKNLKEGVSVQKAGFPNFKKIKNSGGIRIQLSSTNKEYTYCWNKQQLFVPCLGVLKWRDQGYVLGVVKTDAGVSTQTQCLSTEKQMGVVERCGDLASAEANTSSTQENNYAKMITIRKSNTGKMFATFAGNPQYNDKRREQKKRSVSRQVIGVASSVKEFLDDFSAAYDINRFSGQVIVASNHEQELMSSGSIQYSNINCFNDDSSFFSTSSDLNVIEQNMILNKSTTTKNYTVSVLNDVELEKQNIKIKRKEKRIKHYQQQLARQDLAKKKGRYQPKNPNGLHRKSKHSKRRMKTQIKLNFEFEALNNIKDFYLLALAQKMVQGKKVVFLEDLDVKGMLEQDKPNNKSTQHHKNDKRSQHKASFAKLVRCIEQVCEKNGVVLIKCDRYDATSQLCHLCGYKWGKLPTNIRTVQCKKCKVVHDRDYNATQNIKFLSLYRYWLELTTNIKVKKNNNNKKSTSVSQDTTNKTLSLAERVDEGQAIRCGAGTDEALASADAKSPHLSVIHSLDQISHVDLMDYIRAHYPIDTIISHCVVIGQNVNSDTDHTHTVSVASAKACGKRRHARFSKTVA